MEYWMMWLRAEVVTQGTDPSAIESALSSIMEEPIQFTCMDEPTASDPHPTPTANSLWVVSAQVREADLAKILPYAAQILALPITWRVWEENGTADDPAMSIEQLTNMVASNPYLSGLVPTLPGLNDALAGAFGGGA